MSDNPELVANATEYPVFDFEELSWGDSLRLTEAQTIIGELTSVQTIKPEDMRKVFEAYKSISAYLAKITVSIPRSWLVKDAPEGLNFSDPDSFGFVKQKKIGALMTAFGQAMSAEKNE